MGQGGNCVICKIVSLLVILGALNWGLIGIWNTDLVVTLLGNVTNGVRIAYIVIGVAGLLKIAGCFKLCPCQKGSCGPSK